jgi:BirA family biotin operon repressor/biotin-[acetyl-CoA-carboxylase] ligase
MDPRRFERVPRIDSTSAELMRRPFGHAPRPPCALLADVQEAGRGRNGRGWLSDPSRSIALSVAVEREGEADWLGLPLAIGVAIAGMLAAHGATARLKWPNDVVVDAPGGGFAKAGGVLVEARRQAGIQRVVAGVGLNLEPSVALDPRALGQPVGALFAPGAAPDREPFARALADALADVLVGFPDGGLAPWLARWRALDALVGTPIDLIRPDGTRVPALADGVDEDGALRARLDDGRIERVIAGEVSVRARVVAG